MNIISKDISKAIDLLERGHLVAIPTETVYGLAGNIFNPTAVGKIFETKNRPHFNPLIVHIPSITALDTIVSYVPEKARKLAEAFWPGSLTLILPKHKNIPDLITAGKDTVGVRVPNHTVTLELLSQLPFPLAAPSANPFNRISPTKPKHVASYFEGKIQMVLDGGPCEKGLESTIIGFENEAPVIYRLGAISLEEIESIIGKVEVRNTKENRPDAPGMLMKHYAPRTKIIISENIELDLQKYDSEKIGILGFNRIYKRTSIAYQETLSEKGDLQEAASNLYQALHRLDDQEITLILAERFPDKGLGKTINDRLQRASS